MLDLLLSMDMTHFSGWGGGRHRLVRSTWERFLLRVPYSWLCVREKKTYTCVPSAHTVCVYLPVGCRGCGTEAVRDAVLLGGHKKNKKKKGWRGGIGGNVSVAWFILSQGSHNKETPQLINVQGGERVCTVKTNTCITSNDMSTAEFTFYIEPSRVSGRITFRDDSDYHQLWLSESSFSVPI